jgi:hypothetical protein
MLKIDPEQTNLEDIKKGQILDTANFRMKVPLHGPLKSIGVQLEDHMTNLNY